MEFHSLPIADAVLISLQEHVDQRGFFARAWCEQEFREHGLAPYVAQVNFSHNDSRGTLRGMHYQVAPHEEAKLVRCVRGAIFDVVADVRPGSPTLGLWYGAELTAANRRALYVPPGCAHGFVTLEDDSDVLYQVSEFYTPGAERGFRWNDPAFAIDWPLPPEVISDKDASWAELGDLKVAAPAAAKERL